MEEVLNGRYGINFEGFGLYTSSLREKRMLKLSLRASPVADRVISDSDRDNEVRRPERIMATKVPDTALAANATFPRSKELLCYSIDL